MRKYGFNANVEQIFSFYNKKFQMRSEAIRYLLNLSMFQTKEQLVNAIKEIIIIKNEETQWKPIVVIMPLSQIRIIESLKKELNLDRHSIMNYLIKLGIAKHNKEFFGGKLKFEV